MKLDIDKTRESKPNFGLRVVLSEKTVVILLRVLLALYIAQPQLQDWNHKSIADSPIQTEEPAHENLR